MSTTKKIHCSIFFNGRRGINLCSQCNEVESTKGQTFRLLIIVGAITIIMEITQRETE